MQFSYNTHLQKMKKGLLSIAKGIKKPANAGKTLSDFLFWSCIEVHSRVCGKDLKETPSNQGFDF